MDGMAADGTRKRFGKVLIPKTRMNTKSPEAQEGACSSHGGISYLQRLRKSPNS